MTGAAFSIDDTELVQFGQRPGEDEGAECMGNWGNSVLSQRSADFLQRTIQ